MPTIADVARQAKVSMMTVSRVINNSGSVSEQTRRRVLKVIEELGYRPNMMAKGLATRRSQLIAYVVSNLGNPFFGNVSTGVANACAEHGYTTIVYDVGSEERMRECLEMLVDRQIDGAIFHHLCITPEQVQTLAQNGVVCATIDNEHLLEGVINVDSCDYESARMAVRHLIERGHRRIACIHGRIDEREPPRPGMEFIECFQRKIWRDRLSGFLDAMREADLQPVCVLEGSGTVKNAFASGSALICRLMELPDPPTAVYCLNDLVALGALGECIRTNVDVPGRIAIMGHDGVDFAMLLYPRVSTAMQPQYEMGFTAAERLIRQILSNATPEVIRMPAKLFIGETT